MEKKVDTEALENLIKQIDVLRSESGPKGNDFIKWTREVKSFIEKNFGGSNPQLSSFKKIDYYPKQFDILSSESSFKKAWLDGLTVAQGILESLRPAAASSVKNEAAKNEADAKVEKQKETERNNKEAEANANTNADANVNAAKQEPVKVEEKAPVKEQPAPVQKNKKEDKPAVIQPEQTSSNKGGKVLLVNICDEKLNEDIFMFVKKMGYEPVVVDQSADDDVFSADVLNSSMYGNPVYAIIHWRGEIDLGGKRCPKPYAIFTTGYYVAKLSSRRVLIISYEDINMYDENYKGFRFMGIDNIRELMELKLAREMDAAGLDIDFNFLKKK